MRASAMPDREVAILARVLGNDQDQFPPEMARYLLTIRFGERDKARMHELAVRNQEDSWHPASTKNCWHTPGPAQSFPS